ncbi:ferrochelatase hem15 [Coemansia sp. RSA 2611]|nr:ferrochelatase hem15 [Coemansia sp. RSA 2610]KAJ2369795.1 ferrochelatase hem15 [Coemansia sp. RSA 2611]KAJ2724420.1 ferrochelatase hem15 [Coemansia sp. Cherry 401B]
MNMGGPRTQRDVAPFLSNIFADRDIIKLPLQKVLGQLIARRRVEKVKQQYMQIGGGSPIEKWTRAQGDGMVRLLDRSRPETAPHRYYVGFRYTEPSMHEAVERMLDDGVGRVIAFTQYQQYSGSTTGSNLNELYRVQRRLDPDGQLQWSFIDRWGTHPKLVSAFADRVEAQIWRLPEDVRRTTPILFSAHSLPLNVVDRGDPYVAEVGGTVAYVVDELRRRGIANPYRLTWQSAVGPLRWLCPQTEAAITSYGARGFKSLVMVPIAFTSDHIETLFELDIEYGEVAEQAGITHYLRAEALNDYPPFIDALATIVKEHMDAGFPTSPQLLLPDPGEESAQTALTRQWIADQAQRASPR